jgi:DNA-binding transcriptional ArsR family regulator
VPAGLSVPNHVGKSELTSATPRPAHLGQELLTHRQTHAVQNRQAVQPAGWVRFLRRSVAGRLQLPSLGFDRQVITCLSSASVGDIFKALADPSRRAILDELADRDGQTLFEICSRLATKHQLSMSRQAISQHLDLLEAAGLVGTRREGRYKFHDLQTDALKSLVDRWVKSPRKEKR